MHLSWIHAICVICSISFSQETLRECTISTFGSDYRGQMNTTLSGRQCQRWDAQFPHEHTFNNSLNFPDRSVDLAENYCRNPTPTNYEGLWCFTTDPDMRWDYCDVPMCSAFPECKMTELGESYRGFQSSTVSSATCEQWPDQNEVTTNNYCRNPDDKQGGPWCYTEPTYTQWEHCDVPFCKPSAWCTTRPDGTEYIGTIATTEKGIHCQRWDDTIYHISNYTSDADFPDATVADAADFCRNPRGDKARPWCYTLHPDVQWGYCDIDQCAACRLTESGTNYAGTVSVTSSGYICQRWDTQTPHTHNMTDSNRFPDKNLATTANYCRNPDGRDSGPWCYTTDPDMTWKTCSVPICTGADGMKQPTRGVKHVVHIGIDGLAPCFVDAPAPNIMGRIAAEGVWNLNARTVLRSVSGPSWTSILCGINSESSGVVNNQWSPPWKGFPQRISPSSGNEVPIQCIFDVLKRQDHNVRTAAFYLWDFFEYITSTGLAGRMDYDIYCDPSVPLAEKCDNFTATYGSEYFREVFHAAETSYTFIYQMGVDEAGHNYTWCEEEYMEQVRYVDANVGYILDIIDEEGMKDDVMVVVTSDHGGLVLGHGLPIDEHLIMPMFFRGPGIKRNHEMQFEVRNEDVSATIMQAMGFRQSPWWKGMPLNQIFE